MPQPSRPLPMISPHMAAIRGVVAEVCIDMSPAFIKGTADSLPNAAVTFDRFHAVKIINDAVDQVRRTERKPHTAGRHALPLAPQPRPLSERQRVILETLPMRHLKTPRAYGYGWPSRTSMPLHRGRSGFPSDGISGQPTAGCPRSRRRSRCQTPLDGILRWFQSRIANGLIEGINNLIQAAKAKARGYRSIRNLTAMVYLLAGQLNLSLPE